MTDDRLPAKIEVSALVRAVQAQGGFATVIAKGEPDAGTIVLLLLENGGKARLYERMPQLSGERKWICTRDENSGYQEINALLAKRREQDPDLWIVELDIPQAERFIVPSPLQG
ncbi:MAG: DUF1491 family protein [Sphingomonadales bacterium]|nr:DUF1491 family protein [Sphingomonadales bacterium]